MQRPCARTEPAVSRALQGQGRSRASMRVEMEAMLLEGQAGRGRTVWGGFRLYLYLGKLGRVLSRWLGYDVISVPCTPPELGFSGKDGCPGLS